MSPVHRQRGMAVIAALLVVVAASALAAAVIERQGLMANILITERDRIQASWLLRGGLDWSRVILLMDARNSPTTRLDGVWAQPVLGLPVGTADDPDRALFSGQVEDEQSKFNLRNLAERGRIDPRELEALESLLRWLDIDPKLAKVMAQRVAQSQYNENGPPRAVGLRGIDDLRLLDGFTARIIDTLQPFVTVLPVATTINANTASAEVLGAVVQELGLAGARELVVQRDKGMWFTNRGDFINRVRIKEPDAGQRISVNSNWFRVTGEVTVGATLVSLRALLHRANQGLASVRWVTY
ncbi:type II secretion system minor pseudopilin GspK [Pusillimonas sp.]|uniref:type II secretion system minor pseudopilin GspK n=1 Tax=Pusillimonas sp. TaxID=3040095 RepID=UPI0037C7C4E3